MIADARRVAAPDRETELIVLSTRLKLEAHHRQRMYALLGEELDWTAVIDMAWVQRVLPLLYTHLKALEGLQRIPQHARDELHQAFLENARWNLVLSNELRELLDLFEREGIPAIPYKGPVLAQQVYGSVALRENGDLDLIVPRTDVNRVHDLLLARGYLTAQRLTPAQRRAVLRFGKGCEYVREPQRTIVELHWSLTEPRARVPFDMEAMRARCTWIPFAGTQVRAFDPNDLLVLLCLHGARHLWERLEWLCAVGELVRAHTWDWDDLLNRAAGLGLQRVLLLGVGLAHQVLETPLPAEVLRRVRMDDTLGGLLLEAQRYLLSRREGWSFSLGWPFHRFQIRLMQRPRERARYLAGMLVEPGKEDWSALPLPDPFFPLYHLIRPFRLSASYARRLARSHA